MRVLPRVPESQEQGAAAGVCALLSQALCAQNCALPAGLKQSSLGGVDISLTIP